MDFNIIISINIMKSVFILAVLSLAAVAASSSDDSSNNNVQRRIERDAGKTKQKKKIQKAKKNKKAKNRTNKKTKEQSGKEKKRKAKCPKGKKGKQCRQNVMKERKVKCSKGKEGIQCRRNKKKNRQNIIGPSCPPTPTCPAPTPAPAPTTSPAPSGCSAVNTAYTQYKRATNWMKQCTRVNSWNTIITNKGGKKDYFMAGAMALDSATMNGTSCAGEAANTTVNDVMNTLKNCSTSIGAACPPNPFLFISACEATNQCQTDLYATKMAFEASIRIKK